MDIVLTRDEYRADGIFGEIFNTAGSTICYTLEHAYQTPSGDWVPKIPPGTYVCVRGIHTLEDGTQFETFEITGVAGHYGLCFHWGCFNKDTKGCVMTGDSVAPYGTIEMITNTKKTFSKFMKFQNDVDEFMLKVME